MDCTSAIGLWNPFGLRRYPRKNYVAVVLTSLTAITDRKLCHENIHNIIPSSSEHQTVLKIGGMDRQQYYPCQNGEFSTRLHCVQRLRVEHVQLQLDIAVMRAIYGHRCLRTVLSTYSQQIDNIEISRIQEPIIASRTIDEECLKTGDFDACFEQILAALLYHRDTSSRVQKLDMNQPLPTIERRTKHSRGIDLPA